MNYSLYYQASIKRELCWMVTATFRFSEHIVFDRALDKQQSLFEFFVAPDLQKEFLDIMAKLETKGVISDLVQLPNRLQEEM